MLYIFTDYVKIIATDSGPGIEDIEMALQEGFSTAGDEIREMGFGAGMGLPNIQRCVNQLEIDSQPGNGTRLEIYLHQP